MSGVGRPLVNWITNADLRERDFPNIIVRSE